MNRGEIILYVFAIMIFCVCIYTLLFTGPKGFNIDIQRKRQKRQKFKEQTKMKNIDMKCKINGKEYELPEHASISVRNGVVYVDNKKYIDSATEFANDRVINIEICGNVEQIASGSGNVIVHGNANFVQSSSGDIEVNADVRGNVQSSSGDISCGNVGGDVKSISGDISCLEISGEPYTVSGDVTYRHDIESRAKNFVEKIMAQHNACERQQQPKSKGNVDENYVEML